MVKEKKSTAALALGVLSLIFWLLPVLGLPVAVIGIILGIKGLKNKQKLAQAALICSIIGLALAAANAALGAYLGATGQLTIVNKMMK